ncbi:MAG: DNA polymerase III subunit beta [Myxococcales bacterium]|nr:DNA polymerase III subunit beta [Myxococcales bacterium]|tara:strand:- start:104 stop:1216 length:1113 start_codon:yes stop_codon:yes gene_type:complete
MKFTIQSSELTKALFRVQGIADKKSTMPILAHVLIEASNQGELRLSATDLEVGLTGTYEANVSKPGSIAVHARHLYDILKALPEDEVNFEVAENQWIKISSGKSNFKLVGMSGDEFPNLPSHTETDTFQIPSEDLAQMIERTIFCVSADDNRHNLSGVYCEVRDKKTLRLVATDGHRLAFSEKNFTNELPFESGVIVPKKGFQELRRVLQDDDAVETVELGFTNNSGFLRADNVILTTRLIEGQFPDYQQVIPQEAGEEIKISKSKLSQALRRVSLLSQGKSYGVRFVFNEDSLELVAEDPELGNANETIDVAYQGNPLTIGFNARYIMEVLGLVSEDSICLELTDDLSPGIIQPLEETGFLTVIMPMRI